MEQHWGSFCGGPHRSYLSGTVVQVKTDAPFPEMTSPCQFSTLQAKQETKTQWKNSPTLIKLQKAWLSRCIDSC